MLLLAAVLSAWCFAGADAFRRDFQYIQPLRHAAGALALYTFSGTVLGALGYALTRLGERLVARAAAARTPRAAAATRVGFYALLAMLVGAPTAFATFSGEMISRTLAGRFGPFVMLAGMGVAAAIAASAVTWLLARAKAGRAGLVAVFAVVAVAAAALLSSCSRSPWC
jgi:hypothetical protein